MVANILCIKWGKKYGSEYVNRLLSGTCQHLSIPFRFVCLTDDATGIDSQVEVHPLPVTPFDENAFDARKGGETWRKVGLFQPNLANLQGDTLFLDLDVVLTGSLDDFFTYQPESFCVIHDWLEKRRAWMPGRDGRVGNTSVFRFNPEKHARVYHHFCDHQSEVLEEFRIEQQYVSRTLIDDLAFWPSDWVCSFKRSCRPTFPMNLIRSPYQPSDMRVLAFHGYPLPDQAIAGYSAGPFKSTRPATWLKDYWTDAA
ncbi:hypothetical protein Q31b_22950 [Novipirellula aureliae]|uniref:Glycosyltransferase n=1 Tax=Novipirellula aureliae TaxID=2527966 RepID=A0A5C6E5L5_9BACT|nr:hypothetical protein [Novipirellula aureliae]TWU43257.1 hypothetical protein Q31b_22950 [Novipirellula aureliae]